MAARSVGTSPVLLWRASTESEARGPGVFLTPVLLRSEYNSGYVVDRNNGSLWGGRGVNSQLSAGFGFGWNVLSAAIQPEINAHQNRPFEMRPTPAGRPPFANPFYSGIDLPQRFGDEAFLTIAPGQSYVRADVGAWAGGVSTENLWWGPGLRQSIVLSNTAAGFPHAFLESNRPVDIRIGHVTLAAFWGQLRESAYFDTIPANDRRLLTGLGLTFQPRGLRELTLGVTRIYAFPWDSLSARNLIPFLEPALKEQLSTPDNPLGNSNDDQRVSAFFHWKLAESGFEMYGEYGREDHSWDLEDFVQEPEHSAAFLVGLQKLHELSSSLSLRVQAEWVNVQQTRPNRGARSTPVYYVHRPQGHTYQGQILGAGTGPGSESQFLTLEILSSSSAIGGFVERVRRDEMSTVARAEYEGWPPRHDVEMTAGLRGSRAFGSIDVGGQLSLSRRLNRNWVADETNVRAIVQAEWHPNR